MLRAITLALTCAVGASAIAAQETPAKTLDAMPQPRLNPIQPGGRISGIVIFSDTQKPARGISVHIARDHSPGQHDALDDSAKTDIDGRYQFDHLNPGNYYIRMNANGYLYLNAPGSTDSRNPLAPPHYSSIASTNITLHTNEAAKFDVTFQRSASLSGHVFYDDGSPAIGAQIRVELIDPGSFYRPESGEPTYMHILRIGDRGIADERGYFRITTLGPGTYRVAASPPLQEYVSELPSYLTDEKEYSSQPVAFTIFSGDTIHRAKATTYKLQIGEDLTDIRINIPLANFYKVSGNVEADDGRVPNEGVVTLIDNEDTDIRYQTNLEPDGSFTFATIPDGTYKLALTRSFIAKPNTSQPDYKDDDTSIETNAFSAVDSIIIVKSSDILDLHFKVHEIPMPSKPPDYDPVPHS